jgi:hypothetical protein
MSIRYPVEVTIESQTKKVNNRIERYQFQLDTIQRVLKVIKNYEGQKITKRIATAIQKEFGEGYCVYLSTNYSFYEIHITKGNDYDNSVQIFLEYKDHGQTINYEKIVEKNQCYLLNEGRLVKLKDGISHIPELIAKRNQAIEILQTLVKQSETFEMDYDFDIEK